MRATLHWRQGVYRRLQTKQTTNCSAQWKSGGEEELPLGCIASSLRHRRTADLSPTEVVTRLARGYKTDTPELGLHYQ